MNQRPQATVADIGNTREIDGTWYTAQVTAEKGKDGEYHTLVKWYLAKWKAVAKARREAQP